MSVALPKTVERLKIYKDSTSPILSIYFHLPVPKQYTSETIVNKLQTHINANLTIKQRKEMRNNIQYIVGFMQKYQQARGEETIAIFSGGDNLFEVLHLPYKLKSSVTYSHEPYLTPLLKAQEATRRFLVILNDREKAIFYTVFSGRVEDQEEVFDNSVPKDISGIGADGLRTQRNDKIQRHIHDHLQRHFNYIAQRAADFIKDKPIAGVILGGHKTELSQFEKHLPKDLKEKVVGNFVSELHVNFNEILKRSDKVIEKVNKQFNQQLTPA